MQMAAVAQVESAKVESFAPAATPSSLAWSLVKMIGALAIVFSIFFAGVWLMRNGQRVLAKRGLSAKLQILEAKSLGARQTIYVVGYEKQRMLIASSPAGVNFLSALPAAENETPVAEPSGPAFADILRKALSPR